MLHMNLKKIEQVNLPPNQSRQGCDHCGQVTTHAVEYRGGLTVFKCCECGAEFVRVGALA